MWTKYTGVLIWKMQNPWTGLRGQFYDHLHDQTGGFYGCRCAAEPLHVQLNLATYFVEVMQILKFFLLAFFLCKMKSVHFHDAKAMQMFFSALLYQRLLLLLDFDMLTSIIHF